MILRHSARARFGRFPAILAFACLFAAPPASAQMFTEKFGGFSKSTEPIDIESDSLEVRDQDKVAIFKGNVKAAQGKTTLRARELRVSYSGDAGVAASDGEKAAVADKPAGDAKQPDGKRKGKDKPSTQITKIEAKEKVLVTIEQDQTATSDWAIFDVKAQTVTIGGNVVLSQGGNVIKGDRLVIDLKTSQSRFETGAGGPARVKGVFMPKQGKDGKAGGILGGGDKGKSK